MKKIFFFVMVVLVYNQSFAQKSEVEEANNRFAIEFYQKISESENSNIFFSPISITSAMGMTCVGAADETQKQIENVFHFPHESKSFHSRLGGIQKTYNSYSAKGVEVSMVNKLWAEKTYKMNKGFAKQIKKDYSSSVDLVDFIQQSEVARNTINSYVSNQTKNRINDLLPSGSINSLTRLVITNAIYFKADWQVQFESKKTKEANFYVNSEKKEMCKMMSLTGNFRLFEGGNYQALELPYKGENLSMLIILPVEGVSIESFQKNFSYSTLQDIDNGLSKEEVWVLLPRFKSSTGYQLKPILSDMGMPTPFSNGANFSKISSKNDLKIFDVYHKAFVEVNEKGTEAAAATAVVIGIKSVQRTIMFEANRPFIYFIRDSKTGLILFMGRLSNPTL